MICGIDESGRGPVIGPLVIAGVSVDDEKILTELGVADSKKCTPKRRERLEGLIKNKADKYEILVIPANDLNTLMKTLTLNEIEVYSFCRIIEKIKPERCIVDSADVNEERFKQNILSHLSYQPELISKHKADEIYPVVSAASILAKTERDRQISLIEKELQDKLHLPLGSGYPADPVTMHFLRVYLKTYNEFPPHIRYEWSTVKNLLKEYKNKKIDEY
ncbi:MAG: ribonuclease HII [Candidatus Thermoplasmatota archaeon]